MSFPTSQRNTAWSTFVSVLKADPVLKREIKTLKSWSGDPKDAEDFSIGLEPYIRLTPRPDQSEFASNTSIRADIVVDVEIALKGTNVSDILDAWGAIELALYPKDHATRTAIILRLEAAGIRAVEPILGGWAIKNDGGQVLQAHGTIRLVYFQVLKPN